MDIIQKQYYYDMAKKNRLFMFYHNERKVCLITFYIGNDHNKYIRSDMWSVLDDEPHTGTVCFIDHLWTDKDWENPFISYRIWHYFKEHIKKNFPQVEYMHWVRVKINKVSLERERKIYIEPLRGRLAKCMS